MSFVPTGYSKPTISEISHTIIVILTSISRNGCILGNMIHIYYLIFTLIDVMYRKWACFHTAICQMKANEEEQVQDQSYNIAV